MPTEAALLPTTSHQPVKISDYREQLVEMLNIFFRGDRLIT